MVKKKKTRSNTDTIASDVDGLSVEKPGFPSIVPLKDILAAEGGTHTSCITSLAKVLKNEATLSNIVVRPSLLCESMILAFFTTKPGSSMLSLSMDESAKSMHKRWLSSHKSATSYRRRISNWKSDEVTLLKFVSFLFENRSISLDFKNYDKPKWKLSLKFLVGSKYEAASLILQDDYNLLLDYFFAITPLLEKWLRIAFSYQDGQYFRNTIVDYKRVFEFSNYYTWYTFIDHQEPSIKKKYLINILFENEEDNDLQTSISIIFDELVASASASGFHDSNFMVMTNILESDNGSYRHQVSQDENVYSFDINEDGSIEVPNLMSHTSLRHDTLLNMLKLKSCTSPLLLLQFKIMCGLVDPLTQPATNDEQIISLDMLYQMFLGFLYPEIEKTLNVDDGCDWRFHICFNMQKIIQASLIRMNCDDFDRLNSINNTDEAIDWRTQLSKWLPHGFNTQNLELIYMIDILAVYSIYKLYEDLPIQINPFLSSLISLWKNLTCVILLGLEIDRQEEEHETFDTPILVRATTRGATALRAAIATILNGHVDINKHDFKHESFNTFMSPHGRKLCQGALYADLRSHAAALLALGTDLKDVTDILADMQAGDRFDEDVRYMFEYELDDYNDAEPQEEELQENQKKNDFLEEVEGSPKLLQRRCNCVFDDDEMLEDNDNDDEHEEAKFSGIQQRQAQTSLAMSSNGKPHAVRSRGSFEFDYSGKDWRDVPRGANFYYSLNYDFLDNANLDTVLSLTLKASSEKLNGKEELLLLTSVASCVKKEQDEIILGSLISSQDSQADTNKNLEAGSKFQNITPDDIYEIWCEESTFEKMVYTNHSLAWRLMDEMLVCCGYRRVLIWFITHMELNHSLIHYIFELVMDLRGQASTEDAKEDLFKGKAAETSNKGFRSLPFSRQGPLLLSVIERKMLLQEFFTNAAIFLSQKSKELVSEDYIDRDGGNDDSDTGNISLYAVGLMKLICLMVQTFIKKDKFDFSESECVFELQALLMNWIAIIPEAKDLFFTLKSLIAEMNKTGIEQEKAEANEPEAWDALLGQQESPEFQTQSDFEYNRKLVSLLPPVIEGKEENAAMQTLRNFIKRYSFNTAVPVIGRKVVYEDEKILPLPKSDTSVGLHEYLVDYDENYNLPSEDEYDHE